MCFNAAIEWLPTGEGRAAPPRLDAMDLAHYARDFAAEKHRVQRRKYFDEPYVEISTP